MIRSPMRRTTNEQFIRNVFDEARPRFNQIAAGFVDEPDAIVEQASTLFDKMIPDMAYREKPHHPMVFECSASLAVYLALKAHGVDAHRFGGAMLNAMSKAPLPVPEPEPESDSARPRSDRTLQEHLAEFVASAKASQTDALPGEFVYETVFDDEKKFDWGMNVESCAIGSAFSKHDAMDLVPYMCATDDVVSDRKKQGLRRSGTIAVGASFCDFRFQRGGEPQRLAEQYPDQIHGTEDRAEGSKPRTRAEDSSQGLVPRTRAKDSGQTRWVPRTSVPCNRTFRRGSPHLHGSHQEPVSQK